MRLTHIAALVISAVFLPVSAQAYSGNLLYCGEAGDAELYVDFDLFDPSIARLYTTIPGGYGGAPIITELKAVEGTPNPVFAGEDVSLSLTADEIVLNEALESFRCQLSNRAELVGSPQAIAIIEGDWAEMTVNLPGKSWAGVLRAGPGMDYKRVTSLTLNQPLTLDTRTDVEMDGFYWYRVTLETGVTGFKWGGILCDPSDTEAGTYNEDGCLGS